MFSTLLQQPGRSFFPSLPFSSTTLPKKENLINMELVVMETLVFASSAGGRSGAWLRFPHAVLRFMGINNNNNTWGNSVLLLTGASRGASLPQICP